MKTDVPIHVHQAGVTKGPFSLHEIFENLATGSLTETDNVWDEEANEWVLIKDAFPRSGHSKVPSSTPPPAEFAVHSEVAPPPKGIKPSSKWRVLAFVVIVGFGGLIMFASMTSQSSIKQTSTAPDNKPQAISNPSQDNPQPNSNPTIDITSAQSEAALEQAQNEVLKKVTCRAFGTVIQRLDDGYLVHVGLFTGQWMSTNSLVLQQLVKSDEVTTKDYFVACNNPTLVDDDNFDGIVYITNDDFSYTIALGVQRTLHKLTLSKEDALASLKDPISARQAELVGAARQAVQELESNFVSHLNDAANAISAADLDHAQELLAVAEQLKPNDSRLDSVRTQLKNAQFQADSKSFQVAIQNRNIVGALTALNSANGLLPNDPSVMSFRKQLDELKDGLFQGVDPKLEAGDIAGADRDYSDLAASFPDDNRLPAFKIKVTRSKFDSAVKAFSQALQSQDTETASANLDEAESLIPDDMSLGHLQKELLETKFTKEAANLNVFVSNNAFSEAKIEFSKLQALNIEPGKTADLSAQLSAAIKQAIVSDIVRGKDALHSNDVSEAAKALNDAILLNPGDVSVLAFQDQISDYKYLSGMKQALGEVRTDAFPLALEAINRVLGDRPDDSIATRTKQMLIEFMPIAQAKTFTPEDAIASRVIPSGNVLFTGRITYAGSHAQGYAPIDVESNQDNGDNPYTLHIYAPGVYNEVPENGPEAASWRGVGVRPAAMATGIAPAVGTTVLVYGPVTGQVDNDHSSRLNPFNFAIHSLKILPLDFISKRKAAIVQAISEAVSKDSSTASNTLP